jgi:molybdate transport repressor ModE-like protein
MITEAVAVGAGPDGVLPGIRPGHRVWLQDRGTPVFGAGICELLRRVEATGSLRCAASDMGMAYSKAWQIVRRAEEHLGFALMTRRVGGKGGGCSIISEGGLRLVEAFDAYARDAEGLIDESFARHFGEWRGLAGPGPEIAAAADSLAAPGPGAGRE